MASRLGFQQFTGTISTAAGTLIIPTYAAEHFALQYRVTTYTTASTVSFEASLDGINYGPLSPAVANIVTSATTSYLPVPGLFNLSIALHSIRITSSVANVIVFTAAMR